MTVWCGGEVLDIHQGAYGALGRLEVWKHGFAGGVFHEPNQPGCSQHRRHTFLSEVDDVLGFDDEPDFCGLAGPGAGFHGDGCVASY